MELEKLNAFQLGDMVNSKEISPLEVLDYFEDRINKRNPSLNAFVYTKFDEAREEAKNLEDRIISGEDVGPLAGVPIGLKDFLPTKKGWTASHGGVPSLITTDTEDSQFYKAAKSLGAIAVGKTNAPAFGFRGTTCNKMYGNTHNPFNLSYNSGGSSGGSCAAVGSMLVPLAECGDAGGSTRIPSAWCSCFGFKPSAGLVPSVCRPDAWTATHPYCCSGPASRSVRDAAIVLDAMMEYDPRDPLSVPMKSKHLSKMGPASISGMKIGLTYDYGCLFDAVDDEIIQALDRVADMLESQGAIVDYVRFKFKHDIVSMQESWLRGISVDTSIDIELQKQSGFDLIGDHSDELPVPFIKWNDIAFHSSMMDYRLFHEIRTDILDAHLEVFDNHDIILSPVSCCMPVLNTEDTLGPTSILGKKCDPIIGFAQTWLQNMTGNPAASVPAGIGSNNLPIGVQVVGKRYFDEDVFRIAYVMEECMPWMSYYERIQND